MNQVNGSEPTGMAATLAKLAEDRCRLRQQRQQQSSQEWEAEWREVSNQRHHLQERIKALLEITQQEYNLFRREIEMLRALASRHECEAKTATMALRDLTAWIDSRGLTAEFQAWIAERGIPF